VADAQTTINCTILLVAAIVGMCSKEEKEAFQCSLMTKSERRRTEGIRNRAVGGEALLVMMCLSRLSHKKARTLKQRGKTEPCKRIVATSICICKLVLCRKTTNEYRKPTISKSTYSQSVRTFRRPTSVFQGTKSSLSKS
jgi:hypothetical protein